MNKRPLITIAIPTYNGAGTIKNMLDLLLVQWDPIVEILISDNCSTDNTPQIISDYKKRYPFIKYIKNDKNIGADANFLQCLRLATGKFTHLLSDDDILIENTLPKIIKFLERHNDLSLIYLYTISFRGRYRGINECSEPSIKPEKDIYTEDKKLFMKYAGYYWGFMSSFIIATDNFKKIKNPEEYYGTYWLQSYIHILCSSHSHAKLGVIKGLCIGAGIYVNVSNLDCAEVDGLKYREMLNFAISHGGYDKRQLNKLYIWRICFLGSHSIIKEKAAGIKRTNVKNLIKYTYKFPRAWLRLYPAILIPPSICKIAMKMYRKHKNMSSDIALNREGDMPS